ncbi:MAG TPA: trypsin-like peptidase domain-containing protein [Gemmataceae bacterium]|nr:trypsin-like peptidase domain-containing protein [Gemmataceae bacterium]
MAALDRSPGRVTIKVTRVLVLKERAMGQKFGIRLSFGMLGLFIGLNLLANPARGQGDASGEKVYRQTLRSTVWILSPKGAGVMSSGTGSLIDHKKKLVITNYHVVGENERVIVLFPAYRKGNKLVTERSHYFDLMKNGAGIKGKVLHRDSNRDLALIELENVPPSAAPMRLARDSAGPGQRVHSIGNPGSSDGLWLYTSGTVRQVYHKKWRSRDGQKIYSFEAEVVETQSPTNPGDSGGPLVNDQGELVAITQGTASGAQLLSLFIDLSEVKTFLSTKKLLPRLPAAVVRNEPDVKMTEEAARGKDETEKLEKVASDRLQMAKDIAGAGILDKAKNRYEKIIKDYPTTKAAAEAKLLLEKINK